MSHDRSTRGSAVAARTATGIAAVAVLAAATTTLAQPSSARTSQGPAAVARFMDARDTSVEMTRRACPAGQVLPGPTTRLSPAGSRVSWPNIVVDSTGRLSAMFGAQSRDPQTGELVQRLWSDDLPASPGDPRLIRDSHPNFPGPGDADQIRNLGIDAAGTQTVAFPEELADSEDGNVLVATRPAGGEWSAPVQVNKAPGFIGNVHLAVNAAGAAVATWGRDIRRIIAAYRPAGSSIWLPAQQLVRRGAYFSEAGIDDAGNATVIYDTDGVHLRRFAPGTGWGPDRRVSAAGRDAGASDLAVSPNGAITVTFEMQLPHSQTFGHFTRRRTAAGRWLPLVWRRGGNAARDRALAIDARGVAVAAWWTARHDVVVQTSHPDGNWRHRVLLASAQHGPELSTLTVSMNRRGDTLVVWKARRGDDARLRGRYRPAGGSWAPIRRLTPPGVHADLYATAVGTNGDAAVGWNWLHRIDVRQLTVC